MAYIGSNNTRGIEPSADEFPFLPIGWVLYKKRDGSETAKPPKDGELIPSHGEYSCFYCAVQHSDDSFVRISDGPYWIKSAVKAIKAVSVYKSVGALGLPI
eukprot:1378801-Amphidinium_carterae.1